MSNLWKNVGVLVGTIGQTIGVVNKGRYVTLKYLCILMTLKNSTDYLYVLDKA